MTMDFMKALQYPFEDEDWLKKLGILLVAGLIPIIGSPLATYGWTVETARAVKAGNPKPLASWDDFGAVIGRGVGPTLGILLYQVPTLILVCIAVVIQIGGVGAAAGSGSDDAAGALMGAAGILVFCCYCIVFLYSIAAGIVFAGGFVRYLDKPEFGTFMEFGDNIAIIRNNSSDFLMALLYLLGGGLISGVVAGTGIGFIVAVPFSTYFSSHILGQLAAKIGSSAAPRM